MLERKGIRILFYYMPNEMTMCVLVRLSRAESGLEERGRRPFGPRSSICGCVLSISLFVSKTLVTTAMFGKIREQDDIP